MYLLRPMSRRRGLCSGSSEGMIPLLPSNIDEEPEVCPDCDKES